MTKNELGVDGDYVLRKIGKKPKSYTLPEDIQEQRKARISFKSYVRRLEEDAMSDDLLDDEDDELN